MFNSNTFIRFFGVEMLNIKINLWFIMFIYIAELVMLSKRLVS